MTIPAKDDNNHTQRAVDYNEEGRKLLARVHLLDPSDEQDPTAARIKRLHQYSNPIYKHPQTGGTIHVGNHMAAESLNQLNQMGMCRRIVYCLDGWNDKPFQDDPEFIYLTFNIGWWRSTLGKDRQDPNAVVEYFAPLFEFLDRELALGNAILIHCLAGAHRAGTAGIASLMYLTGMNAGQATKAAQKLRPIINPIGDFPELLQTLEEGLKLKRKEPHQEGEAQTKEES